MMLQNVLLNYKEITVISESLWKTHLGLVPLHLNVLHAAFANQGRLGTGDNSSANHVHHCQPFC